MRLVRLLVPILFLAIPVAAQNLEIHYIDVGWGGSVLVKGPNGTTVLMEAGDTGKGTAYVVPYLQSIGIQPANGLDYMIGGHQHCDHIGGLDEVINAGYNVRLKQYYNGSTNTSSCVTGWNSAAATTTAGAPVAMPVGTVIQLGNGATLTCVARNGSIIGGGSVAVTDENDRSIALLIKYGGFDYLWASDLGGGSDACTGRSTSQLDVETAVINAISPGGAFPLISAGGIDLLHINHHGSESSTNPTYFNKAKPAVAIIGVGDGQSAGWDLPRIDVVDHVLLGGSAACVTAPPVTFVFQTEEGNPGSTLMSKSGYCVGNIKVTTDGLSLFTVSADGGVHQGPNEVAAAGLPRSFTLDEGGGGGGDTILPTTSITAPANGATVSATVAVNANASDNVGVTKVEFYLDGALKSTDTTSPYSWSWDTTTATNGAHALTTRAYDAALNVGSSATVNVTVSNGTPLNIGSWTLTQANATLVYTIPAGTTIPSKGYVIIARNATKAAFQTFWGRTLGANVVYINSADGMPQINGSETYTLKNSAGTTIEGATVAMDAAGGSDFQRATCGAIGTLGSWTKSASTAGSPGSGGLATCNRGAFINEFSDALGTGNFVYEFIEIFNDK
ncbi:MAG TPA: Ig-like domain-containing protein [Thermoanaerobaculia bacterium]|nr:Ig-like domain-containing protein [Thermoanaerobaculia bacterium]